MNGCTAFRGQGAAVRSPRKASHARGRASAAFSSRRPAKPLFRRPAAPVRTAAAPERLFRGRPTLQGAACPTVLSADRAAAACPKCGKASVRSPAPGDPDRTGTAGGARPSRSACAGTAAVRTAWPAQSRATRPSKPFDKGASGLLHDAAVRPDDRRWTRRRPFSGPASRKRFAPTGQAHRESARFEGEGSIGQLARRRRFESRT